MLIRFIRFVSCDQHIIFVCNVNTAGTRKMRGRFLTWPMRPRGRRLWVRISSLTVMLNFEAVTVFCRFQKIRRHCQHWRQNNYQSLLCWWHGWLSRRGGAPQMVSQPVSSIVLCSLLSLWDLGLGELKACSFPDVVFPPLLLSALFSPPFHCASQDGFGQTWWTGGMSILL